MKISIENLIEQKNWLHVELIKSFTPEFMKIITDFTELDVKFMVNDIEIEPVLFTDLVNNIEKYIDKEAIKLSVKKLHSVQEKIRILHEIIEEATDKIKEDFELL